MCGIILSIRVWVWSVRTIALISITATSITYFSAGGSGCIVHRQCCWQHPAEQDKNHQKR